MILFEPGGRDMGFIQGLHGMEFGNKSLRTFTRGLELSLISPPSGAYCGLR